MKKSLKIAVITVLLFIGLCLLGLLGASVETKLSQISQDHRTGKSQGMTELLEPATLVDINGKPKNHFRPGEPFFVHRHFKQLVTCSVQATRFMVDLEQTPTHYYSFNTTTTTWVEAATYDVDEGYEVPLNIPHDTYQFRLKELQFCAGTTYYTLGFDITLTVE